MRQHQDCAEDKRQSQRGHGVAFCGLGTVPQLTVLPEASRPAPTAHGATSTCVLPPPVPIAHATMPSTPIANAPIAIRRKRASCSGLALPALSINGRTNSTTAPIAMPPIPATLPNDASDERSTAHSSPFRPPPTTSARLLCRKLP